jgi:phosphoserine phosphatase
MIDSAAAAHQTHPPLVILDCDSTTIEQEVIELLAEAAGTREEVARITEQAMRGELDFAQSLQARVATLADVPESALADAAERVTFSPGYHELVAAVHSRGGRVGVVSGGFVEVLDQFLPATKTDAWRANRLEVADGRLTGNLLGSIVDAAAKAEALREWSEAFGIPLSRTIAIGDGANDLEMMRVARFSVGYRPKPIVHGFANYTIETSLAEAIPLLDRL